MISCIALAIIAVSAFVSALAIVGYRFRRPIADFIRRNLACDTCGNLGFLIDNEGYKTCPHCAFGDELRRENPER